MFGLTRRSATLRWLHLKIRGGVLLRCIDHKGRDENDEGGASSNVEKGGKWFAERDQEIQCDSNIELWFLSYTEKGSHDGNMTKLFSEHRRMGVKLGQHPVLFKNGNACVAAQQQWQSG